MLVAVARGLSPRMVKLSNQIKKQGKIGEEIGEEVFQRALEN